MDWSGFGAAERCGFMCVTNNKRNFPIKDIVLIICILAITCVGLYLRYLPIDFISDDMQRFLIPWFQEIKVNGGFAALSLQVGDYGLLYQTIIAAFSYSNINPVYLYKALSILFDVLLASSVAYFISKADTGNFNLSELGYIIPISYGCVLLLPTVIMNSAFWGQCDSIYTLFLLWSLWFLYKEKYGLSLLMLGCSFAFKLQCILLMPLFVLFCFCKRFSFLKFLITVFTFWFSGIVAFVYGRGLLAGFSVYLFQVGEYKRMWMNVPSFWFFFDADYERCHVFAICLTFMILSFFLLFLLKKNIPITSFKQIIAVALLIEWTCIIFLPAMHERYTYVMDILVLLLAFSDKNFIKYALIAIGTSCITYNTYLFASSSLTLFLVLIYIMAWLHFTLSIFSGLFDKRNYQD